MQSLAMDGGAHARHGDVGGVPATAGEAPQLLHEGLCRGIAVIRVLGHAAQDHALEALRQARCVLRGGSRRVLDMHPCQLEPVARAERQLARGRFVQRDTQRVEVRPAIQWPPLCLLRRDVVRRADGHVAARSRGRRGCRARDSEIRQDRPAIVGEQDVVDLDVAMNDLLGVGVGERVGHVLGDLEQALLGDGTVAGEQGTQGIRVEVHGEVHEPAVEPHLVDVDDVRVGQAAGNLRFVAESALELGVARVAWLEQLHRHGGGQVMVAPGENPGEPALPEQAFEDVGSDLVAKEGVRFAGHRVGLYRGSEGD
jgi:hypothetical protein